MRGGRGSLFNSVLLTGVQLEDILVESLLDWKHDMVLWTLKYGVEEILGNFAFSSLLVRQISQTFLIDVRMKNLRDACIGVVTGSVLVGLVNGVGGSNATTVFSEIGLLPASNSEALSKPASCFLSIM